MKKTAKFFLATALVMAVTSMAAFAQASSAATAWTIRDDVDYATDYRYYKDANVNNYLLSTNISTSGLNFGFGKQFEKNYLGISYDGNLWGSHTTLSVKNGDTKTTSHLSYDYGNTIRAFGGFSNMSFGGSFTFKGNKEENGTGGSTISPSIFWSGNFDSDKFLLKPYVEFAYAYTDIDKFKMKNPADLETYITIPNIVSNNISFDVGADFVSSKGNTKSILNIDNVLAFSSNDFKSSELGNGTLKLINEGLTVKYNSNHQLKDNLTIGWTAALANSFNFSKNLDAKGNKINGIFNYILTPTFALGMKFDATKNLSILLGDSMTISGVNVATAEIVANDEKATLTTVNDFTSNFSCGFDWTITENMTIDMNAALPISGTSIGSVSFDLGLSYRK